MHFSHLPPRRHIFTANPIVDRIRLKFDLAFSVIFKIKFLIIIIPIFIGLSVNSTTAQVFNGTSVTTIVLNANEANISNEIRLNDDAEIYLRPFNDNNHGLGWYGITGRDPKIWDSRDVDGPVLYGYDGGVLGTNQYGMQHSALRWRSDGVVVIGDVATPGNYKLYVEQGILTERIRVAVKTTGDWRDNVFDTDYSLMPLPELKNYLQNNHHLPEVPTATEVVRDGIDLQQMQALLLQKVEELTLYVIRQQEEIEALKKLMNSDGQ